MKIKTIKNLLMKFWNDEDGLTIVEYAIAGGLVTLAAVAGFTLLGDNVAVQIDALADCVPATAGGDPGADCPSS